MTNCQGCVKKNGQSDARVVDDLIGAHLAASSEFVPRY